MFFYIVEPDGDDLLPDDDVIRFTNARAFKSPFAAVTAPGGGTPLQPHFTVRPTPVASITVSRPKPSATVTSGEVGDY